MKMKLVGILGGAVLASMVAYGSDDADLLFNPTPQDVGVEVTVAAVIHVNDDDDQSVGELNYEVHDFEHAPSKGDDDLFEVKLNAHAGKSDALVVLHTRKGKSLLRADVGPWFWPTKDKRGEQVTSLSWPVPAGTVFHKVLYIEGVRNSSEKRDVAFQAEIVAPAIHVDGIYYDDAHVWSNLAETSVYQVDLDVDSSNDNYNEVDGFEGESGEREDAIEASDAVEEGTSYPRPGKIVVAQGARDSDSDGLPDFADGFSIEGIDQGIPENVTDIYFTPVRVELPTPFDPIEASVTFHYGPVCEPRLSENGIGLVPTKDEREPDAVVIRKPGLRLWRHDAVGRSSGKSVPEGDFIEPGTSIKWSDLDMDQDRVAVLYVDYVASPSIDGLGRQVISVEASEGEAVAMDEIVITTTTLDLAVDANRDGKVRFPGDLSSDGCAPDLTAPHRPLCFWLNHDQDSPTKSLWWEDIDPETVPVKARDSDDLKIKTTRDLEDFARLDLMVEGLEPMLVSGDLLLGLEWKDLVNDSKPSIRLFRNSSNVGDDSYLKTHTGAAAQLASEHYSSALIGYQGSGLVEPKEGPVDYVFPPGFWQGIDAHGRAHLLFEGVRWGRGSLRLVLMDRDGTVVGEGGSLWLMLMPVDCYYERVHARPAIASMPEPHGQYKIHRSYDFPFVKGVDLALYWPDQHKGYAHGYDVEESGNSFFETYGEEPQHIVFVHGIKMKVHHVKSYTASCYKRLWWAGYRGRLSVFRWTTPVSGADIYNTGEFNAWHNGAALAAYVDFLKKRLGRDGNVGIIAHSLGNAVVGGALRAGMTVNSYLMMEAAVPMSCFHSADELLDGGDSLEGRYERMLLEAEANKPSARVLSDGGYRGVLFGFDGQIVGKWVNYYNPLDFWLATGKTKNAGVLVHWLQNQVRYKPNDLLLKGVYKYFPDRPVGDRARFGPDGDQVYRWLWESARPVYDLYESLSFTSRSLTRAMGAQFPAHENGDPLPPGGEAVNLEKEYHFGSGRPDHSGQFQRDIQQLYSDDDGNRYKFPLYHRMLNDLMMSNVQTEK
ncbi:hypothetical protein [Sulfuriroseicoccus oceanibius]|uniref:Alpha/beta hydrolase n=1 Tax=Sulfuriroseicoccus oceanibius TaxID=2707525 RepID=A0A6B3L1B3_9BACT|nr:hypothetical protein [Sulfuriroseicoccus oceanibius]QQL43819.1 hypothetical protein G3M56_007900 [Sulfuriroseicoccus oceanibius]